MSVLKIGLIGCGCVARMVHLDTLARLPGVELVALAESDPQRLEWLRAKPAAFATSGNKTISGDLSTAVEFNAVKKLDKCTVTLT